MRTDLSTEEILQRGRSGIARSVLKACFIGFGIILPLALMEPANDDLVTLAFYAPVFALLVGVGLLLRAGSARAAGYLLSTIFFLVSSAAVVVLGGVTANATGSFLACIMIAAATAGSRATLVFTALSICTVFGFATAQTWGMLPEPLAPPDSIANAVMASIMPIAFAVYLLREMLALRHEALEAAAARAAERDKAEADLIQAQKMDIVGRLSSGIAHDFNNLLTVIRSSVDVMRLEGNEDELLDDIEQSARRATMLTSRLLTFARPKEMEPSRLEIGEAVDDFRPLLETIAGDEVRLNVDSGRNIWVEIDPLAFQQILLNLVINGREAQNGRGTIWVELDTSEDEVELIVRDDGPGVPDDVQESIFEPFFTTKSSGTGLGLSTVASLVEASAGTIALESNSSGARFVIRWPRAETSTNSYTEKPITLELMGLPSVLVVDDNIPVRKAMASLLRARGSDVMEAGGGLEALALLESWVPDIVVSDNSMPGMTGVSLSARIREEHPTLPILIVSGNPLEVLPHEHMAFLPKPFGEEALVDAMAELLERREVSRPTG